MRSRVIFGRGGIAAASVATVLATAPGASGAQPAQGHYWDIAAGSRRVSVTAEVERDRARLGIEIRRCGGLSRQYLRQRQIEIEGDHFDITAPLPPRVIRIGQPRPNDRVRVIGRWTSPRTVVGRYRMWRTLLHPRTRRARRCDTRWVAWRAALDTPVLVSAAWPAQFTVPGTVTGVISVANVGDFPSPDTVLRIVPTSQITDPGDPPAPPMQITADQGTCRWPVAVEDSWPVIECALGTVAPRRTVAVRVTETWDERLCDYAADWPAQVTSPLNWYRKFGIRWLDADEPDGAAEAVCPGQPPEEPTESEAR